MRNYNYKQIILKGLDPVRFYADFGYSLNGANTTVKCCLPGHDDKNPSLSLNSKKGFYKCFGCGRSGHMINFYMDYHCVSQEVAIEQLAEKYNIKLPNNEKEKTLYGKTKIRVELVERYHQVLPQDIRTYLNNRGIPDNLIEKYKLGWGEFYGKYWITIPVKDVEGNYALIKLRRNPLEGNNNDN